MTKKIHEKIDGLKDLRTRFSYWGFDESAISTAIDWGEALERVKNDLPKKIERLIPTHPEFSLEKDNLQIAHNELIDLIRPILAKALLEIEKWKELHLEASYEVIAKAKELQAQEDRIEELEKKTK